MQGIKEILEMLPESGDISSCTDSNEERDIYGGAAEVGVQNVSVAPFRQGTLRRKSTFKTAS
jgi:hypothetical protein